MPSSKTGGPFHETFVWKIRRASNSLILIFCSLTGALSPLNRELPRSRDPKDWSRMSWPPLQLWCDRDTPKQSWADYVMATISLPGSLVVAVAAGRWIDAIFVSALRAPCLLRTFCR